MTDLEIHHVGPIVDVTAADGSELVLLARTGRASMAHGSLRPNTTSHAIEHRTVDEVWYVVSGRAEIWRSHEHGESIVTVETGASLAIPCGTRFQYRTIGAEPFCFVMATIPAWPGDDEAIAIEGVWPA